MKVHLVSIHTENKIKAILFALWVVFIHLMALAGGIYFYKDYFGPF
ncbi:hypothetical protein Oweho_3237 [Owenweeksia hongkongensis DSM 17368]|uniref:Uncharacterized protein n=1 Tax=Owenweeksia hongkongensis (strain DSM 17368 / CIP 108786 / JCM 12287 / NRRL B-23963 / UST20020801) TaxID=926562 RepID=G8R488_OWEHD|nr:hypothetical protein Oweho_3237 [Owenweeksia hongkongensis DSM 17368]